MPYSKSGGVFTICCEYIFKNSLDQQRVQESVWDFICIQKYRSILNQLLRKAVPRHNTIILVHRFFSTLYKSYLQFAKPSRHLFTTYGKWENIILIKLNTKWYLFAWYLVFKNYTFEMLFSKYVRIYYL